MMRPLLRPLFPRNPVPIPSRLRPSHASHAPLAPQFARQCRVPFSAAAPHRDLGLQRLSSITAASSSCSHHEQPHSGMSSTLNGSCKCGSVTFAAHGPSSFNFTCHCQICRDAVPGSFTTTSVGFKPHQVAWTGRQHLRLLAKASDNYRQALHYECGVCHTHMYEDATSAFGMYMLPARVVPKVRDDLSEDLAVLPPEFRPNHHIFYRERLRDVRDGLPKWKTVLQGQLESGEEHYSPDGERTRAQGHSQDTGQYTRHVTNLSPPRVPEIGDYLFTTQDPSQTHVTHIAPGKVRERVATKYEWSPLPFVAPARKRYDVIIVGGGHNGLVAAAYLAKNGQSVLVLERRHIIGGAAVTEELVPGFKFSRASYLAGLLRPRIIKELELEKFGFKYLVRDPSSFTPTKQEGRYLMMGANEQRTLASIAQFSAKDARAYVEYERFLKQVRSIIAPLLDSPLPSPMHGRFHERLHALRTLWKVASAAARNTSALVPFYELLTAPANYVLDRWFESEMLKTTLATDAVVGSLLSPREAGSAYILLHHVMGEAAGQEGVWAYVEGGMGSVSNAIAQAATASGAHIHCNAPVKRITYAGSGSGQHATGVEMADGTLLHADTVLSNANPYHTFLELLPGLSRDGNNREEESPLPKEFVHHIRFLDYSCGAFKINCAISELPNFSCCPSPPDGSPGPQHRGTIHFESTLQELDFAAREATMGMCVHKRASVAIDNGNMSQSARRSLSPPPTPSPASDTLLCRPAVRPIIELTIPTSLDTTLAPPGKHVAQLFVQFAPYTVDPKLGNWADPRFKHEFVKRCFRIVDEYAPNFSKSVIGYDALSPLDIERIFGLQNGCITHTSLALHQLAYNRPAPGYSVHRSPLKGLYLCGAGAHPGGGVQGAAGRNCALVVLSDMGKAMHA